jgi:hypothetical protein
MSRWRWPRVCHLTIGFRICRGRDGHCCSISPRALQGGFERLGEWMESNDEDEKVAGEMIASFPCSSQATEGSGEWNRDCLVSAGALYMRSLPAPLYEASN